MYKIVPVEQQECSGKTITKNRCKPSKNGLQRSFLAPPAGFEPVACRLGEEPNELNQMQRNTKETSNIKAFPALPYIQSTTKIKPKQG